MTSIPIKPPPDFHPPPPWLLLVGPDGATIVASTPIEYGFNPHNANDVVNDLTSAGLDLPGIITCCQFRYCPSRPSLLNPHHILEESPLIEDQHLIVVLRARILEEWHRRNG